MRRFIAYTTIAAAMLVAVGTGITPVLTQIEPGREFATGREITFTVKAKDNEILSDNAVDSVAEEMRIRLNNFDFEDYSVKVQKNINEKEGAVTVSFSCEQDIFNSVCNYLTFSGENFALSGAEEETIITDAIKYDDVYIEQLNDLVPIVVIPLTDTGKEKLATMLESSSLSGETAGSMKEMRSTMVRADDGEEETQKSPDVYLWGNYESGDNIESANEDPEMKMKVIMAFYSEQIWFTKADGNDTDDEHYAIKIICGSMNEAGDSYDFGKLRNANLQATYFANMLKANKYDYVVDCPTKNVSLEQGVDYFTNSLEVAPYAGETEALFVLSNTIKLKWTTTLITTLIAYIIIVGCLAAYFRVLSPAIIATSTGSIFLSFLVFSNLGALFNLPALIGALIVLAVSLFGQIFYLSKFKEEVYKGRNFKKANQEASKKSNLVTLDSAVIGTFAGLMCYLLGGVALKPMGVILFFGSLISLAMNLIVFKGLMHLVTNSTSLQNNYSAFGINAEKVPNIMLEQKPNYVHPLEQINYTKGKKLASIIFGALSVVSLAFILAFGISKGSPLNIFDATKDEAIAFVEIKSTDTRVVSESTFKTLVLENVENVTDTNSKVSMKNINVYDTETKRSNESLFFTVKINKTLNDDQISEISSSIYNNLQNVAEINTEDFSVSVLNSHELVFTPDQGGVALATGITIAGVCLYLMLRYRASRGISVALISAGSALISYGVITALHIGTTAVTSLAMPIVAVVTLLASLAILNTEKALVKENHEQMDLKLRNEIMLKALSKSAIIAFAFGVIEVFLSIIYFGFGMKLTTLLFVSTLIGEVIGYCALFMIAGPFASLIEKWFSKIHLPKFKFLQKKNNNQLQNKPKTSEPVETTFIGIND